MALFKFYGSKTRSDYYRRLGTSLVGEDCWEVPKILDEVKKYEMPTPALTNYSNMKSDVKTEEIFRCQNIRLKPVMVKADGNCLFNSVSLAVYATETYSMELRVRCCVHMFDNPRLIEKDNVELALNRKLSDADYNMMIQSSVDSCIVNSDVNIMAKAHARKMMFVGKYASILEVICLADCLNISIDLIYPSEHNLFTKKELFSGRISPTTDSTLKSITLSWTSTSDTNVQSGRWMPNHFVPCGQLKDVEEQVNMDHEESTDDKEIFDDGEKLDCKETMDNKDIKHGKENTVDNDQDDGCQQDSETDNSPPLDIKRRRVSHKKKTPQVTTKKQKNKRTDGKKCKVEAHGDENKDNQAKGTAFNREWCSEEGLDFVRPSTVSRYHFYCVVCRKDVSNGHMGRRDVIRHMEGARHIHNKELHDAAVKGVKGIDVFVETENVSLEEQVLSAEVKMTNWLVQHNIAFNAMEHLQRVLKASFPDSKIMKSYACSRTKATQVAGSLANYYRDALVSAMSKSPFSICVDGSNDNGVEKMYPILVRIFNPESGIVDSRFLDICSIEGKDSSTAESIYNSVTNQLTRADESSPWRNCVAIGLDNTNVNIGRKNSLKSRILEENESVYIQGCPCHIIHNTAKQGASAMAKNKFFDLDEFLNDLCQHVSTSKRKNALKEFVEFCNSEYRKIIRHSNVRWLSIGRCVQRILQIYEPLKAYIISDEDNCKDESRRMERLREAFEDPLTECYLLFINHVITLFDGANLQLQTDGPQIHLIHEIYETLYTDLLHLFLTPECVATLDEIDPHSVDYLPDEDISVGFTTRMALNKLELDAGEMRKFIQGTRTFLLYACMYAKKWFPLDDAVLINAKFLNKSERNRITIEQVMFFYRRYLHLMEADVVDDTIQLSLEINRYKTYHESKLPQSDRVDKFWWELSKAKIGTRPLFGTLARVAMVVCVIPHSNASEERLFSQTKKNLRPERSLLDMRSTLNNIMVVKNTPHLEPCEKFVPPREVMKAAKAATQDYNNMHKSTK